MIFQKALKLLRDPLAGYKKVIPFLSGQISIYKRKLFELFGNDKYSKPYPGHEQLLQHIGTKNGFFVVGGGNDGYFQDPTYFLEKFRGWTGIIIEPLPVPAFYCRKNRSKSNVYQTAIVDNNFEDSNITLIECNAMTIVKNSFEGCDQWIKKGEQTQNIQAKEIIVPTLTLDKILENHFKTSSPKKIDLLTLDIEGYEINALRGLNLEKYSPRFILVEIHTPERKKEIEDCLEKRYEMMSNICEADYLYKLKV